MPSSKPRLVTRVSDITNDKFKLICERENRTASNLLELIILNYINEYEMKNGKLIK